MAVKENYNGCTITDTAITTRYTQNYFIATSNNIFDSEEKAFAISTPLASGLTIRVSPFLRFIVTVPSSFIVINL